jgi:hypothetical protein
MGWLRRVQGLAAGLAAAVGICLLGCGCARAQGLTDGAIVGVVRGPDGERLRRVVVTAIDQETGLARTAETRRDGGFVLVGLAPGQYVVEVDGAPLAGTIDLNAGSAVEANVTVGAQTGPMLSVPPSDASLPAADVEPDENDDGLVSRHGLAANQGEAAFDGVGASQALDPVALGAGRDVAPDGDNNGDAAEVSTGPAHGLSRGRHAGVAYTYAEGSVREFRVGADGYSAQAGRAGGVLTAVTRQGGERLHGSGAFDLRSSALAARSPLALATSYANGIVTTGEVKPHDLRMNGAIAVGGPVWFGAPPLRALHYFYAGDVQRRGFPAVSSPASATFYQLTPGQTDLLANRGVTAAQTEGALNFLSAETGTVPRRADQSVNFGRLDWRARPKLAVGVEYNRVRWTSPAGLVDAPVVARGRASLGNAAGSIDQVLARASRAWRAGTRMEVRAALTRDLQYETPQAPLAQEAAIGPGGLSPEVNIGPDGLLFGTPATLSQVAYPDERRWELGDVVTLVRGRHVAEFGGTFAYVQERVATLGNAAGTFRYDSGTTDGHDGGLVDFIADYALSAQSARSGGCATAVAGVHDYCFRSYTQSFGEQQVAFSTQEWAGFAEDTWRAGGRLMLHAGLRYEYQFLPLPQQPNAALDALFSARGATSVFPEDRNNLGPRVSAAFEPFGKGRLLVKVGYGAFFGRMPGATIQAALTDTAEPQSTTRIRITPTTVTACPQAANEGFGYLCSFTSVPVGVAAATASAVIFDRRFRLPVVQQGSVYLEREVRRGTMVEIGLLIDADRQLPGSTDMNIAPPTGTGIFQLQGGTGAAGVRDGETFAVPVYRARMTPSFGPVTDVVSNGNAYYDALMAKIQTRPAHGILLGGTYTWSKAIDFGTSSSATPRTDGQFDPFADGYDRGLSSLNYPQALHVAGAWTPGGEGVRRGIEQWKDGWTLTGISTARSGRPYSCDVSGGTYLPGGHESLNGSGGALYLPTVGRNTLRLPPTVKTDLRLGRRFTAWRGAKGLASVEALNVFNHQSVSSVNERAYLVGTALNGVTPLVFQSAAEIATEGLNTTAFGTPTGTGSSLNRERQVQFSVKVSF